MDDVDRIVSRLSQSQRDRLMALPTRPWWTVLPCSERREFVGLIKRFGYETNVFTKLGLAVRARLAEVQS